MSEQTIIGYDYASGPDITAVCLRVGREIRSVIVNPRFLSPEDARRIMYKAGCICTSCHRTYAKCLCY